MQLLVACDVQTLFTEAAPVFAPQKGASPAQVDLLRGRLERLVQMYRQEFGVDVRDVPGTGAAGGLAGGLVALGGRLVPGFDLVADEVDLHDRIGEADLAWTRVIDTFGRTPDEAVAKLDGVGPGAATHEQR